MTTTRTEQVSSTAPERAAARDPWLPAGPTRAEVALGSSGWLAGRTARLVAGPALRRAMAAFFPLPGADLGELGDPGWFGPDSMIWRVHADPAIMVGAAAAVSAQGLHPRAFAGFADHTDFNSDPTGRLTRTANALQAIVYGDTNEARAAIRNTNRAHRPVQGTMPDGRTYDAREPELAMWVHATTFAGTAAAYRRFGGQPLSDADLDHYIADTAVIGRAFGLKDAPRSWAEMDETLASYRTLLSLNLRSATGISYFREPFGIPPALAKAFHILWPATMVCLPPICRRLLMQPEPTVRELATARAIVRGIQSSQGEQPWLTRAKARVSAGNA